MGIFSSSIAVSYTHLKMPHMDGLEATRLIRSYSKEVPIVALTAFAFESDKDRAIEAGCDDLQPLHSDDGVRTNALT